MASHAGISKNIFSHNFTQNSKVCCWYPPRVNTVRRSKAEEEDLDLGVGSQFLGWWYVEESSAATMGTFCWEFWLFQHDRDLVPFLFPWLTGEESCSDLTVCLHRPSWYLVAFSFLLFPSYLFPCREFPPISFIVVWYICILSIPFYETEGIVGLIYIEVFQKWYMPAGRKLKCAKLQMYELLSLLEILSWDRSGFGNKLSLVWNL